MKETVRGAVLAVTLVAACSCAATSGGKPGGTAPASQGAEIAALGREIAKAEDAATLTALLFQRGHAYLDEAEKLIDLRDKEGKGSPADAEFARNLLGAIRDFEEVANTFPQSEEAPESLFHLGVIYDYPILSSFGVALSYYKRTIEEHPGTESAFKAMVAMNAIKTIIHDMERGQHGTH